MARTPLFAWSGREYEHRPKSAEWYSVVVIIALSTAVASLLFSNYLLAVVIVCAAFAIILHARKEPPMHEFKVTEEGLFIGSEFHGFPTMTSFSILEDTEGKLPPLISIKTTNWLAPHLVIPLEGMPLDKVYAHFATRVAEEEHRPTITDMVAGLLGF